QAQSRSTIPWVLDAETAFDRAEREGKPVLLLLTGGIWCDPCLWFDENALSDPGLVALVRNGWVPLRIEDTDPQALRWDRTILPTLLLLQPDGREIDRIEGNVTAETAQRIIASAVGRVGGDTRSGETIDEPVDESIPPEPVHDNDLREAVFRVTDGTIWNDGGATWFTQDLDLPQRLEEYDRDDAFLYLRDSSTATVVAITVAGPGEERRLWVWDRDTEGWREIGRLQRLDR
ncbi:MAG: thioredoxin family protein, partial [Alkalispirochaeta sp.]